MPQLPVKGLPATDNGRLLVRLYHSHRGGIARYGVAKITNNDKQKSVDVLVLGHDDHTAIFMPYDIRTALGVSKNDNLDFSVSKTGPFAKLRWYLGSPDPAVHVPAWIATIGLAVAIAGLALASVVYF